MRPNASIVLFVKIVRRPFETRRAQGEPRPDPNALRSSLTNRERLAKRKN